MTIIYGLRAEGFNTLTGERHVFWSFNMFPTREAAEAHIDAFRDACTDPKQVIALDPAESIMITVTERKLHAIH